MMRCLLCLGLFSNPVFAAGHNEHETVVSIDQEPSHRQVLTSGSIRVFDVAFPSEKMSLWHMHDKDSVLVCLDGADVPSEEPGKEPVSRPPIPSGLVYYRPYASKPFVHRIRNASATDFRILDIEVLGEHSPGRVLPELKSKHEVTLENERVRVSKLSVGPGQATGALGFSGPHLLVAMSAGDFRVEPTEGPPLAVSAQRGHLHMQEKSQTEVIRNLGKADLDVLIVEVK